MEPAAALLSVTVIQGGKVLTATLQNVMDAKMVTVLSLMNVSAWTDGPVQTVQSAKRCLDVFMVTVEHIHTPVSAMTDGRVTSVTRPHATLLVFMVSAIILLAMCPTSVFVIMDGGVMDVNTAAPTGIALTKSITLATCPMNASASRMKLILKASAITPFFFNMSPITLEVQK